MFEAIDWQSTFIPALLSLLNGQPTPAMFFNPTWALFPLIPFGVLPYEFGRILLLLVALTAYAIVVRKIGGTVWAFLIFILSVPVFDSLSWGNIEWLALLGLAMPQAIGLVFLAIKPQLTVGIAVFWLGTTWREKGMVSAVRLIVPLAISFVLSIAFFGTWFTHTLTYTAHASSLMNLSFFPYSVPVGLGQSVAAFRKKDIRYAIAASPCFFPVVTPQVWLVVFLALTPSIVELTASSVGAWAVGLIRP